VKRDLIVNTVQCGDMSETTPVWQEIAKLGEGSYAAIAQSGNMTVMATPIDAKLAELNKKMGATLIPYGSASVRSATVAKQVVAEAAAAPAAADRLSFNARTRKAVQGGGELLDALESKALRVDEVDADKLPADLRRLNKDELKSRIAETQQTRTKLQKEITELARQRDEYIRKENQRLAAKGNGDAFDEKVAGIIREEAKRKGMRYER
jgi:hypothetical protein